MSSAARKIAPRTRESKAVLPLADWSEVAVLALIGHRIAPPYPIGDASRWYPAGSLGGRRIAEGVAGVVERATGEDRLARRVAKEAAAAAAARPPAPLTDLIQDAFNTAVDAIDREIVLVADKLAAIRSQRTPAELALLSVRRQAALARAREFDREAQQIREDCLADLRWGIPIPNGELIPANDPRLRAAALGCLKRDVPRLERQAAAARREASSYNPRPDPGRLEDRLSRLEAARQALLQALRDLGRTSRRAAA
jgi:hypothetical protein